MSNVQTSIKTVKRQASVALVLAALAVTGVACNSLATMSITSGPGPHPTLTLLGVPWSVWPLLVLLSAAVWTGTSVAARSGWNAARKHKSATTAASPAAPAKDAQ